MSDFNFDENTINKLKNMMNKGELNDVISQIPPEMIQNFSSMMQNNSSGSNSNNQNQSNNSTVNGNNNSEQNSSNNNSFNFNNIDMNTILRMKSVMEKMNNKNDPRSNLLYSLNIIFFSYLNEKIFKTCKNINFIKLSMSQLY